MFEELATTQSEHTQVLELHTGMFNDLGTSVNQRFEEVNGRFTEMDGRLDRMDGRLTEIIGMLKTREG
jgi:hypothetical protein